MVASPKPEEIVQVAARTAAEMRPAIAEYYLSKTQLIAEAIMAALPLEQPAAWAEAQLGVAGDEAASLIRRLYLEPVASYIRRGGKLMRPFLATLVLEAYGKDPYQFAPVIAHAELIEVSSQILDDIADESLLRRGGPCVHVAYGVEHAYISALSIYDYFPRLLAPLRLPDTVANQIYAMLTYEHYVTGIGSAVDLGWGMGMGHPTEERWMLETLARSSSYTYRAPVLLAALAAGAPAADVEALFQYSGKLGLAFQLKDDCLNLQADEAVFGKTHGEDITGGKRTLLFIRALDQLQGEKRQRLLELAGMHTREISEIDEAIALIESTDAFPYVRAAADRLLAEAQQHVAGLSVPARFRSLLNDFVYYVTERRR